MGAFCASIPKSKSSSNSKEYLEYSSKMNKSIKNIFEFCQSISIPLNTPIKNIYYDSHLIVELPNETKVQIYLNQRNDEKNPSKSEITVNIFPGIPNGKCFYLIEENRNWGDMNNFFNNYVKKYPLKEGLSNDHFAHYILKNILPQKNMEHYEKYKEDNYNQMSRCFWLQTSARQDYHLKNNEDDYDQVYQSYYIEPQNFKIKEEKNV